MKKSAAAELYDVPLARFVQHRNALADRLQDAGKRDEARAVRGIAKPKATVWAVNKVARDEPAAIARMLSAFDRLKRAQLRRPDDIAAAAEVLRTSLEAVVHQATDALRADGIAVSVDTQRRIATTLRGASATTRERLVEGALTEEVAAPGFELFGGETPQGGRRRTAVREAPDRRAELRAERDELAQRRAAKLAEDAHARDREAQRAASTLFEARQRLRELELAAKAAQKSAAAARKMSEKAQRPRPGR